MSQGSSIDYVGIPCIGRTSACGISVIAAGSLLPPRRVSWYEHKPYGQVRHVAPRVLTWLGAAGDLVRGHDGSHRRVNRNLWTRMDDWLREPVAHVGTHRGYAQLAKRYLRAFDPVTERDLVWWFGAAKGAMRQALADLNAVQMRLEREQTGWVLPDDLAPEPPVQAQAGGLIVSVARLSVPATNRRRQ
jgi:Winged helix DNA-binding domain